MGSEVVEVVDEGAAAASEEEDRKNIFIHKNDTETFIKIELSNKLENILKKTRSL